MTRSDINAALLFALGFAIACAGIAMLCLGAPVPPSFGVAVMGVLIALVGLAALETEEVT